MRISILVALLGAAALVPATANAQDHHDRSDRGSHSESRGDRGNGGGERHSAPERPSFQRQGGQRPSYTPQARPQMTGNRDGWRPGNQPQFSHAQNDRGAQRVDRNFSRPGGDVNRDRAPQTAYRAQDHRGGYGDYRGQRDQQYRGGYDRGRGYDRGGYDRGHYDNRQAFNRNWHSDRRYDWRDYRAQNRYAYRLPRYYAPYGWDRGYRRFSIGFTLSSALFGENYWISDPYEYRLPPAYGPYRWVRYYNDALLVDVETGEVVDTVYGIFW